MGLYQTFWHERLAFQSVSNNISGHYKRHYFSFFFFSVVYFSHRRSAWIKKLISQKLTGVPRNLSRPRRLFSGPLAAILDVAGSAAVQVVNEWWLAGFWMVFERFTIENLIDLQEML